MRFEKLGIGIYHFKFKDQYEATSTFMRLQEFYECPSRRIRGRYFTFPQFMDDFARRHGNFTYCTDFSGFNVPSNVVGRFFNLFEDLSVKELKLRDYIGKIKDDKYYLIGTYSADCVDHEIAHAFWYLNSDYKKEMGFLVKRCTIKKSMVKLLKSIGYANPMMIDEIQAYLGTETLPYLRKLFPIKTKWKMIPEFRKVFKKYKNHLVTLQ